MLFAGVLFFLIGLVLFLGSIVRVVHANPGRRVPYWREAEVTPKWSVAMRAGGGACVAFGVGMLGGAWVEQGDSAWWWVLPTLVLWVALPAAVIAMHNARARG
jgi:hypothetical protein